MSRPSWLAATGAALAVLVAAAPADAAWQSSREVSLVDLDTARLSAQLVGEGGNAGQLSSDRSSYTVTFVAGTGSALVGFVNASSVETTVRITLSGGGLVTSDVTISDCSVAWSNSRCATGAQAVSLTPGTAGGAGRWVSPALAPGTSHHLRVSVSLLGTRTTTITAAPAPVARDRTAG